MDSEPKSAAEKVVVTNWVVGPTEDVVQALMEKLVYPRLPRSSKASASTHPPSHDEQKAVARQMHAVVLLYNYYHRKQKPDLRFLELASFCNLAVVLKPSLAAFMKVTQGSKLVESNGAEDQLSLTEKAIKDACDIAAALDASVEVPNTEGWPKSKVAVLLIDSNKENCRLQFGAVTEGVWSLFEKELDGSRFNPEKSAGKKVGDKRKRNTLDALTADNEIMQICYDVVREITGTESNELVVLGSDVAYSLNKEKSATQFYLIQLPGSGIISPKEQVPLKFLVEKLEGPLAEKAFGSWSTTEVVNYYHMLPYVGFISRWLSGKDLCLPSIHAGFAQSTKNSCSKEHTQSRFQNELVDNLKNSNNTECRDGKVSGESGEVAISSDQIQNGFAANTNKPADHVQLCQIEGTTSVVALGNELASSEELQNALALLCAKREQLFSQICSMEDTLAQYEDCIERIRDGSEVGLARRCIESIISGNNHWMLKNETRMQNKDHNSKSQTEKQSSSRLSGIFVPGKSKCQDLEYMCLKNNWRLPRYLVEPSDGKFGSNVVVVSKDMKLASKGGLESSPSEARESAAAQMIAKIYYETEELS